MAPIDIVVLAVIAIAFVAVCVRIYRGHLRRLRPGWRLHGTLLQQKDLRCA